MQLTNRQLFILSYLINHRQRISGEHLASQAGISVRTLQSEIQKINLILDNGVSIDSSSKQGYPLEEIDHGLPISSLMQDITAAVRTIIGVTFSPSELQDCQAKLNNLCTFLRNTPAHRMDWLPRWTPHYDRFLSEIRQRYGVSLDMEPEDQRRFLLHVHKLYRRAVFGQHDSNYHKREINRTYPLAVHLVILAFEECFGFPVPETEVSYLAMYLAMKMRKHFKRIDCIIVTAKHPSVAWPMKQWMEEHFSRHLQSVEIVEHYRFTPAMVRDDMLVLTTGEDVVISCAQAILVKPFRLEQEYDLARDLSRIIFTKC